MSIFASKIEINSGQHFVFSITYQDENVTVEEKKSPSSDENVTIDGKMSPSSSKNVTVDEKMSSSVDGKMSKGNVQG